MFNFIQKPDLLSIVDENCQILANLIAISGLLDKYSLQKVDGISEVEWVLTIRLEHPRPRGSVWGSDLFNRGLV